MTLDLPRFRNSQLTNARFFLGYTKTTTKNLIIYPDVGGPWSACMISFGAKLNESGWGETWSQNTCISSSPVVYILDSNYDPNHIADILPLLQANSFFTTNANFSITCGAQHFDSLAAWQSTSDKPDRKSTVSDIATLPSAAILASMRRLLGI